ncbi:hypothetical protein ES703_19059 [subsurface metagenome]
MEEREILAKNVKRYREFKGLKQKELAVKVGLTSDTISKIETAKQENIGSKYLTAICRELDISMEELFMEDPHRLRIDIVVSDKNIEVVKAIIEAFKNLNLVQ